MTEPEYDKKAVVALLNKLLEQEMAGVVRYTHYSFMVYGYSRIPIVSWLRSAATESLTHAQQVGEMITAIGEHPALGIGDLLETHQHDIGDIMRESLAFEREAVNLYHQLLSLVEGKSVLLEEFARTMIAEEEMHQSEVDKMLRAPGSIKPIDD